MFDQALWDAVDRADGPPLIAYRAEGHLPLTETDWHSHVRGQFFYVESGLFITRTHSGSWMLPPHRAGWLPPGEQHSVSVTGPSRGWGVFIAPCVADCLPAHPCVLGVNDLLRALVNRATSWTFRQELNAEQDRIIAVLLDEIRRAPIEPLYLPMPTDRRLQRIATTIYEHPEDTRSLDDWAVWGGMSPRTLSRLFRQQTACSFAQWRQQARLTRALERLAGGEPVATVADALGYATPSAFVAMFRKSFGQSPGRYFAQQAEGAR